MYYNIYIQIKKVLFKGGNILKSSSTKLFLMLCLILSFTLLIGCTNPKLSEDFDEEEVKRAAEEVISYINNKDSESILEISTVAVKNALTEEVFQEIYEAIGEGGEFEEIQDISVGGQKDKQSEEEFAIVIAKAKYEHKNFIYTITFTKQMKLAGLFYK